MPSETVKAFCRENHMAVVTTFRRSGGAQMSIVTAGPFRNGVAFSTTGDRAKLANLKRNPKCSLMVSQDDWRGYVVLEGTAELLSPGITEAEELRQALREVFRSASGGEHPDWEEFDRAMVKDERSVVVVVPEHVYGTKG